MLPRTLCVWMALAVCAGAAGAAARAPAGGRAAEPDPDSYHRESPYESRPPPVGRPQIDPAEHTAAYWSDEAAAGLAARLAARGQLGAARNVVLFLGDGMSVPTLAAARALLGQRRNQTGEEARLHFEDFPTAGLAKTYCVNAQVPDSACTATAYLCGAKANRGMLGLAAAVSRRDCAASLDPAHHLDSLAAWALADGRDAGIVTTTRVTHASPAGTFARAANRQWENDARVAEDGVDPAVCPDIAHQLVHHAPGKHFKVILGGGRREFRDNTTRDEENTRGRRTDGRDLIEEWAADKAARGVSHAYVWNRTALLDVARSPAPPEYLLGLFEGSHMPYHLEGDPALEPTLAELTEAAVRSLARNPRGFFLFVEGGRIDHAHHDNYPHLALDETLELAAAVERAAALLGDDALLVVTADHAHVMSFNGYSRRGADILGASDDQGDDATPYMTLSYTNGPGAREPCGRRHDVTQEDDFRSLRWRTHAEVPLEEETHGGDDVAVFARGPHHDLFSGLYEQSQLPHLIGYAACLGPGRTACRDHPDRD